MNSRLKTLSTIMFASGLVTLAAASSPSFSNLGLSRSPSSRAEDSGNAVRVVRLPISQDESLGHELILIGYDTQISASSNGVQPFNLNQVLRGKFRVQRDEDVSHFSPRFLLVKTKSGVLSLRSFELPHPTDTFEQNKTRGDLPTEFLLTRKAHLGLLGKLLMVDGAGTALELTPLFEVGIIDKLYGDDRNDARYSEAHELEALLNQEQVKQVLGQEEANQVDGAISIRFSPHGDFAGLIRSDQKGEKYYGELKKNEEDEAKKTLETLKNLAHHKHFIITALGEEFVVLHDPLHSNKPLAVYALIGKNKPWAMLDMDPKNTYHDANFEYAKAFAGLLVDIAGDVTAGIPSIALSAGSFITSESILSENIEHLAGYRELRVALESNDNPEVASKELRRAAEIALDHIEKRSHIVPTMLTPTAKAKLRSYHMVRLMNFMQDSDRIKKLDNWLSKQDK